jgi:CRISPR/Cas system-associated exonuclease Cas4 (RecB family)
MGEYSYSKLETFEKCRLKYKYRYIDKIIPDIPKSIEAHLGTTVHETLEWIYINASQGKEVSLDEAILYYSEKWTEGRTEEILIVNKCLTEKDYFNKGVKFIIDYYFKHNPFKDNTIATEKKVEIELDENKRLIGFIDRLSHNLEKEEFEIHDYKTANTLPKKEDLEKNRQLAIYSLAIKKEYGTDTKISLNWHYLAHNERITIRKTEQQLESLKKEIIDLINEIENTKYFPPTISRLCDWCEYKNICEAWKDKSNRQKTLGI